MVVVVTVQCLRLCWCWAGGGCTGAAAGSGSTSVHLFRKKQHNEEAFLGCRSHATDLQQRAEFGEDYRIFGGVVTDDWVDAVQASSSLGLCDCVLASSDI
jgi:hypothetical protein